MELITGFVLGPMAVAGVLGAALRSGGVALAIAGLGLVLVFVAPNLDRGAEGAFALTIGLGALVGGLVTWLALRLRPKAGRVIPALASAVIAGAIGLLFLTFALIGG